MLRIIATVIIGYLLGSISTGVLLSRAFANTDIRSQGSGNAGTTNMLRVLGRKMALLTFLGDMLKGIIAVCIGKRTVGFACFFHKRFKLVFAHGSYRESVGVDRSFFRSIFCSAFLRLFHLCGKALYHLCRKENEDKFF